jgi:hypothetical protein
MHSRLALAFLCFAAICGAQSAPTPPAAGSVSKSEIVHQEELLWQLYTDGDTVALEKLMLPDFTSVSQQISDRDDVLGVVKRLQLSCTISPVTVNRPEVAILSPDVATIVYSTTFVQKCAHRTTKSDARISTVWVRRDGRWQMHLHTESVIPLFAVQTD